MRKRVRIGVVLMMLCALTGCETMEQGPVAGLPIEATEAWIEEVQASGKEMENTETIAVEPEGADQLTQEQTVADSPENTEVPTPTPEPESYEFTQSDKEYFADALFIGDSRTVGLQLYGTLDNADYFAAPGLSLYSIPRTTVTIGEYEDISLEELLEKKDYGKIYLMLGINELGYNYDTTVARYNEMVEKLRAAEQEAILYVCANLHVTSLRDENDEIHNNDNINRINGDIAALADQKDIFYLDVNMIFDDEAGNLKEEYASDDSHVLGTYYEVWCDWLGENTIVK